MLHNQLADILTGLNGTRSATAPSPSQDEWTYIGVGRDDGYQKGEYSPILYRPSVWAVKAWKTVWLSPTPDQPGLGWDATSVRIVTVGTFMHRDFVFVGKNGWDIKGSSVLSNRFEDGVYSSDHRAVVVDAVLDA